MQQRNIQMNIQMNISARHAEYCVHVNGVNRIGLARATVETVTYEMDQNLAADEGLSY